VSLLHVNVGAKIPVLQHALKQSPLPDLDKRSQQYFGLQMCGLSSHLHLMFFFGGFLCVHLSPFLLLIFMS